MRKFIIIGLSAAAAILVSIVVLIVVTLNSESTVESPPESAPVSQLERTLSGKTLAEDQADVLQAAIALLQATDAPLGAADYETRMLQIEQGNFEYSEDLRSKIRFVEGIANDEAIERTLLQSLVTFGSLSKQSSGSETITALFDNASEGIVVDQEVGVAYVPTTLFINSSTGINGFSLEFVYVDGEWLFAPYMTLDQLRLALVYNGAGQAE